MNRSTSRITSDLFLFFTSLAIAFVIWLIAKGSDRGRESFGVPIAIKGKPANVEARVLSDRTELERVQATATFPQSLAFRVKPGNFVAVVDWDALGDPRDWSAVGNNPAVRSAFFTLNPDRDVQAVAGLDDAVRNRLREVRFVSVDPARIAIEARFITRPARIVFATRGKVAEGYRLAGPITPKVDRTILLTASNERFAELGSAKSGPVEIATDEIDLTGLNASLDKTVYLRMPEGVEILDPNDRRVDARIAVEQIIETRAIAGVPVVIQPLNENLAAEYGPTTVTVTVKGPAPLLKNLRPADFAVRPVQLPQERDGTEALVTLKADFAPGLSAEVTENVRILSVAPESLRIKFSDRYRLFRF